MEKNIRFSQNIISSDTVPSDQMIHFFIKKTLNGIFATDFDIAAQRHLSSNELNIRASLIVIRLKRMGVAKSHVM